MTDECLRDSDVHFDYFSAPMVGLYLVVGFAIACLPEIIAHIRKVEIDSDVQSSSNDPISALLSVIFWPFRLYQALTRSGAEKLIDEYNKAIGQSPDDAISYCNRGAAYGKLGDHQKALEDANRAIELDPTYMLAYCNRGIAFGKLGQHENACEALEQAQHLDIEKKIFPMIPSAYMYDHAGKAEQKKSP